MLVSDSIIGKNDRGKWFIMGRDASVPVDFSLPDEITKINVINNSIVVVTDNCNNMQTMRLRIEPTG
jgi:hypothetical protein